MIPSNIENLSCIPIFLSSDTWHLSLASKRCYILQKWMYFGNFIRLVGMVLWSHGGAGWHLLNFVKARKTSPPLALWHDKLSPNIAQPHKTSNGLSTFGSNGFFIIFFYLYIHNILLIFIHTILFLSLYFIQFQYLFIKKMKQNPKHSSTNPKPTIVHNLPC